MSATTGTAAKVSLGAGRMDVRAAQEAQKDQVNRFKERTEKSHQQTEKLGEIRAAWQDALARGDIDTLKIVNANFEAAARENAANSKDISQMMVAVLEGYKDVGVIIKATEELNEEEKKILSSAEELLDVAKGKKVQAEAMQDSFLNRLSGNNREAAIASAKEAIATAEEAVRIAKQTAETMRRERLNKMDLKQSMQLMQAITQELIDVAEGRISEIENNLVAVQENVTSTMDEIKKDTKSLEDFDAQLKQANGELVTLNEELSSYVANTSEWQDCRGRIIEKTRSRDAIEADRNAAFARSQEGQRFVEFSKMEEQGQVQLLSQHKNWISLLQMGTKQRDVLYAVHLGLLRGAADQEAMAMSDQVATETDERMVLEAAMKTQAMRRNTLERINRLPDQVRRLRQITETDVQNQTDFEKQLDAAIEEFRKNFGTSKGYDDRNAHRTAPAG